MLAEKYIIEPNVIQRNREEYVDVVNLDLPEDRIVRIDGLALKVWKNIDGIRTLSEIIDAILASDVVPPEMHDRFRLDVVNFIEDVLSHGLIKRV